MVSILPALFSFSLFFFTTLSFFVVVVRSAAHAHPPPTFVRTPLGARVPLARVRTHALATHRAAHDHLAAQLAELSPDGAILHTVLGPLNLTAVHTTRPLLLLSTTNHEHDEHHDQYQEKGQEYPRFVLNGRDVALPSALRRAVVRFGPGFEAVYVLRGPTTTGGHPVDDDASEDEEIGDDDDQVPVTVFAHGALHLEPLHRTHHPRLFIHRAHNEGPSEADADDAGDDNVGTRDTKADAASVASASLRSATTASGLPVGVGAPFFKPPPPDGRPRGGGAGAPVIKGRMIPDARSGNLLAPGGPQSQPSKTLTCGPKAATHPMRVALIFDNAFCARHAGSAARAAAVLLSAARIASTAYSSVFCLRVQITRVAAHCSYPLDPFGPLRSVGNSGGGAAVLLGAAEVAAANVAHALPLYGDDDVRVFVAGFNDGTRLSGAAFHASACVPTARLGVHAWVEGGDPRVLAHELAHTLGARHSVYGLMRAAVGGGSALSFSAASQREIRGFVEGDRRASCIMHARTQWKGHRQTKCWTGKAACRRGKCVRGVCVAASHAASHPGHPGGGGACAASLLTGRMQTGCVAEQTLPSIQLPGGARALVAVRVRGAAVHARVAVLGRTAAVVAGAAFGGAVPSRYVLPRAHGVARVFAFRLREAARQGGARKWCCGQRVMVSFRFVVLNGQGVFRSGRYRVAVTLRCRSVCAGRGTPLAQGKARACPVCRKW